MKPHFVGDLPNGPLSVLLIAVCALLRFSTVFCLLTVPVAFSLKMIKKTAGKYLKYSIDSPFKDNLMQISFLKRSDMTCTWHLVVVRKRVELAENSLRARARPPAA